MGPTEPWGPQANLGGCFGGVQSPRGPRRFGRSQFFCLLYLHTYSKIFQKHRMLKLLLGGTNVAYPLGGPPRGPWGLHRGPRVSDSSGKNCKFSQILCENCTCIKIPQIITLTSILGHFGHWGWPGKVKIFMGGWEGVFRKRERWFFF